MNAASELLLNWYAAFGRSHLPWRKTRDPYRILVSEFMLQQTQVDRVLPKYEAFVSRFPDVQTLARATAGDVLRYWKGLGYNSRAVRLQQIARRIVERFDARVPDDTSALRELPGVGAYTAAAVRAFAFEIDDAAVDTNVRRVVHRLLHGIEHPPAVPGTLLDAEARELIPPGRAHDWNSAIMDLGATICTARAPKCLLCPLTSVCTAFPIDTAALERRRAAHPRKRSAQESLPFRHTTRFARGRIVDRLRQLPPGERISLLDLHRDLSATIGRSADETAALVRALERDGLVRIDGRRVCLRDE
ncbi:MAG TPA: A/G-specific adenine glycosylase [Candidatus Baltobacteraceae bacterium]|jgi:A/G-specific adenine glycosylase|nr:A/G-specific adenine glycosylase [Candidatus Baltobacteraceae bacterium]